VPSVVPPFFNPYSRYGGRAREVRNPAEGGHSHEARYGLDTPAAEVPPPRGRSSETARSFY
jgi:hypothetical protein